MTSLKAKEGLLIFVETATSELAFNLQPTSLPLEFSSASACGKVIIVGEHAVVHGAKAIAVPLPQLRLEVSLSDSKILATHSEDTGLVEELALLIEEAARLLQFQSRPASVKISSQLRQGSGLGSSAALCVALLRALAAAKNKELGSEATSVLANTLEKRFHGNPSGLDTAVVAYEMAIEFRRGQGGRPLSLAPTIGWHFMLIDSTEKSCSKDMVALSSSYFSGSQGKILLMHFENIADQVVNGFVEGSPLMVADAMNEASILLNNIGLTTPRIQEIVRICKQQGALAAKVTGAGGGGFVLALLDPTNYVHQAQELQRLFPKKARSFHL